GFPAERQQVAVAVHDGPALGGDRLLGDPLLLRTLGESAGLEALDLDQLAAGRQQQHHHDDPGDPQPPRTAGDIGARGAPPPDQPRRALAHQGASAGSGCEGCGAGGAGTTGRESADSPTGSTVPSGCTTRWMAGGPGRMPSSSARRCSTAGELSWLTSRISSSLRSLSSLTRASACCSW